MTYDVIVVGGGPAGLSAALLLGRSRRSVLLCDVGKPRNAASRALHGFLSRDGVPPLDLLAIGRAQLHEYSSVTLRDVEVLSVVISPEGFEVAFSDGRSASCHKLLIATGVVDVLPPIGGFAELYGRSIFHCPYCDGWELRDQPIAAYGKGEHGLSLALELRNWTADLVLCTDGPAGLSSRERQHLSAHEIPVHEEPIARLEGSDGVLRNVIFQNGSTLPRCGLFFSTGNYVRSPLALQLGCTFTEKGVVSTGTRGETNIHGVYVAGDASPAAQLAIVAAAEGAQAAMAINGELVNEQFASNSLK